MARPQTLNCPIHLILAAPALATASGPVYRATLALAIAYWAAGCRLPWQDESTLASLCRMPIAHLRLIKPDVIDALSETRQALDKERARLVRGYESKVASMSHCRQTRDRRRALQRSEHALVPIDEVVLLPRQADTRKGRSADTPSPKVQWRRNAANPATFTDRPVIVSPVIDGADDDDTI